MFSLGSLAMRFDEIDAGSLLDKHWPSFRHVNLSAYIESTIAMTHGRTFAHLPINRFPINAAGCIKKDKSMVFRALKNYARTMFGVRQKRRALRPGPIPAVDTYVVRGTTKMKVTRSASDEQWMWLTLLGWRAINFKNDRRNYAILPASTFSQLIDAAMHDRDALHDELINPRRLQE